MATSFTHNPILSTNMLNHCEFNNKICKFGSQICNNPKQNYHHRYSTRVRAIKEKTEEITSPDDITQKYGLEAGLWKIFSSKEDGNENNEGKKSKGDQAKDLLAKYGGAYLATSITLSLISFSLCYVLIGAGVDVQALLQKLGIATNETGQKVGTFALAYAAHKAASPIRFPPTVALTPIVANWIGKKVKKED
ncbi:DUF1279 domain-containing protein [Heracleum sosnowskyi]|uniref:DUF1279 domain-containing protein n=1 Tax=Heracleum sosnowskyi TaxID=360622 RepID=A0AAD8N1R9_9APIA|nr:DUF1279 domain-containing protein [Heracleum sosnowskyi]